MAFSAKNVALAPPSTGKTCTAMKRLPGDVRNMAALVASVARARRGRHKVIKTEKLLGFRCNERQAVAVWRATLQMVCLPSFTSPTMCSSENA